MTSSQKCGPCMRDDTENTPVVCCIECEEPLCKSCQKSHNLIKTTQDHHLIECQNMALDDISDIRLSVMQTCSSHQNISFVSYCKDHDKLCCPSCLTDQHRCCESVVPLEVAAKGIKTSTTLDTTTCSVSNAIQVLNDIRTYKTLNIEQLHQNEAEIKKIIETLQENIINRTNEISETVLSDLSRLKDAKIAELEKQLGNIDDRRKTMEARKKHIGLISEHGSEIHTFILTHKLKSELNNEEKAIKKTSEESRTVSLTFKETEDDISSFKTIGEVEVISEPCQFKYRPFSKIGTPEEQNFKYPIYPIKSLKLNSEFEPELETGFVSGMCITDDDLLLLCIRGTHTLLMYTFDGKQKGEVIVDGNPFTVAAISSRGKAVVALPDSSELQMADIDAKEAECIIKMAESCWSVIVIEDKAIVAGGFSKLYVLDIEGKPLEEIAMPENGRTYSMCFSGDKLFYCADIDFKNGKAYCITEDGEFVVCYNDANMKTPTGIAVDNREKIYICDLDSNNVQRYSPSGHFCDVLLKGSEITEPRAICFNKVSKYFALSNNGGKSICVYKSIFTDRLDSKELSPNLTPNLYFADCENKV